MNTLYMVRFRTESGDEWNSPILSEKPTQQQIKNYVWGRYDQEFEMINDLWTSYISWTIIEVTPGSLSANKPCPNNIDWNGM